MLEILAFISFFAALFIQECQVYGISIKIVISSCDKQIETEDILSVNYVAINSHCNCTILSRYNGSLKFASNAIKANCSTEITIHDVKQTELNSTLIPCKGERQTLTFKVAQDSVFYMTSRSVTTTTEPERFLQDIKIFGIANSSSPASIFVTCGSTFESSSAKPSDVITTTEKGYTSTAGTPVDSTTTDISSCDGQMETGAVLSVNYSAINLHCNCTILPRYNGSLKFASNAIKENCYTEIAILELQQLKPNITIPCNGERKILTFKVTQDSVYYMTSRSVNTTTDPERFYQEIRIFGVSNSSSNASISVTCGSTSQGSTAEPSDIITTTTENGNTSTTSAKGNFITKTSPDAVSTYSKQDLESSQPPSTTEEVQYSIFVAVGSGIVVIAVISVIIFCKRRRNQERGTNKSDKLLYGGQRNVANGNNELPYNPLYHSYNNEADEKYSTMEDVNRSPSDELPDNPLYHSHDENIKTSGAANMVEEKTGKGDIPMSETGSNAIYAQPNKIPKEPKSEVEDTCSSQTDNIYAQVKKLDKK